MLSRDLLNVGNGTWGLPSTLGSRERANSGSTKGGRENNCGSQFGAL